jgi:guanylate kinase
MTNKYNIIALLGKAGSGKDSVLSALTQQHPEWHKKISCTSRAPREYEKDGIDYHFLSLKEFMDRPEQFIEQQCFNGWFYGTRYEDLVPAPAINIGVFNISGIEQILAKTATVEPVIGSVTLDNVLAQFYIEHSIVILPIMLSCSDKMRLIHQLTREENPNIQEIFRRFNADDKDFSNIHFSYQVVYNQEGLLQDTVREVTNVVNSFDGFFK